MLEKERAVIDQIDQQMVKLFEARLDQVKLIGEKKKALGLEVLDQSREQVVLDKVVSYLSNPDYATYLRKFYQGVMALAREVQAADRKDQA